MKFAPKTGQEHKPRSIGGLGLKLYLGLGAWEILAIFIAYWYKPQENSRLDKLF